MSRRRKKARNQNAGWRNFKVQSLPKQLQHINVNAAGIDIGSEQHWVAVPEGRDEVSVRQFGAFTNDLLAIADWLEQCGVTTVAMESTGVYWIPLFEVLAARGFEVKLVDARHVKNVSGRKSDVLDCQWLQQLHTYGLLSGAFRPPEQLCAVRSYARQREMLTQAAAQHIQHMQKALQQMNLLLHNVVSDITGVTGMKIIKDIVRGNGEADYREVQISARKQWKNDQQLFVSYVRSVQRGDLNDFAGLFGGWDVPLVQAGGQARLAADAPNRVLAWGTFNLPRSIVVSPVVDWHDGFPYSNVDSRYFYAGEPNSERFPAFMSMDLVVYKTFTAKGRNADIGFQLFNATNHFNPRDVYPVRGDPRLGTFTNSVGPIIRGYMLLKW